MYSKEEINEILTKLFNSDFEQDVCSHEKREAAKDFVRNSVQKYKNEFINIQEEMIENDNNCIEKVKNLVLKEISDFDKIIIDEEFVNKLQNFIIDYNNQYNKNKYYDKNIINKQIIINQNKDYINIELIILTLNFLLDIENIVPDAATDYLNNVIISLEVERENVQSYVYGRIMEKFATCSKIYRLLLNKIFNEKSLEFLFELDEAYYSIKDEKIMNHILENGNIEDIFYYASLYPIHKEKIFKYVSEKIDKYEIQKRFIFNKMRRCDDKIVDTIGEYYADYGDETDINYYIERGPCNINDSLYQKIKNKLISFSSSAHNIITFAKRFRSDNELCNYFVSLNPEIEEIIEYAKDAQINLADMDKQQELLYSVFEKKYLEDKDKYYINAFLIYNYAQIVKHAPISKLEDLIIKTKNVYFISKFALIEGNNADKLAAAYLKYRNSRINKHLIYEQRLAMDSCYIYDIYKNCQDLEIVGKLIDYLMKDTNNKGYELFHLIITKISVLDNKVLRDKIKNYYIEFTEQEKIAVFSGYALDNIYPLIISALNDYSKMKYIKYFNTYQIKLDCENDNYNFLLKNTYDISPIKFINFIIQKMDNDEYEIFIYGAIKLLRETRDNSEPFLQVFLDFLLNPKENIDNIDELVKEYSVFVNQEFTEPVIKPVESEPAGQKLVLENKEN